MRASCLLRPLLVAGAFSAALAAHATFIEVSSAGHNYYGGTLGDYEAVTSQTGGLASLTSLYYKVEGTRYSGIYDGPSGVLLINFTYLTSTSDGYGGGTLYGSWQAAGGTGAYSGVFGGGVWQTVFTSDPNSDSVHIDKTQTTLSGAVNAVPEPASLAALGLGAIAMVRRRSRK